MAIRIRKPSGSSLAKELQRIVHEYMREHRTDTIDLDQVAEWAVRTGRYRRRQPSLVKLCKRDMSRALRNEYYTDPQGREVRVMHPARSEQTVLWASIRTASPDHMRVSLQWRRQGVLADCRQHKTDFDSYNENNPHGATLPLFDYNFNPDLEEMAYPTEYPESRPDDEEEEEE